MNKIIKYNNKLNIIGDKVRKYREKEKLSLSQMSDKLMLMGIDIPKSSLQNIEKGKRVVKEYEFYALCKFFNADLIYLISVFPSVTFNGFSFPKKYL